MPSLQPHSKSPSQSSLTSYSKNYYRSNSSNSNTNSNSHLNNSNKSNPPPPPHSNSNHHAKGGGGVGSSSNYNSNNNNNNNNNSKNNGSSKNNGGNICGFRSIVLIILGVLAMMMLYNVQSGLSSLMECHNHGSGGSGGGGGSGTEEFLMDAPLELLLLRTQQQQQQQQSVATTTAAEPTDDDSETTTTASTTTTSATTIHTTISPPPPPPPSSSSQTPPQPLSFLSSPSLFPLPRTTTQSSLAIFVLSRREAFDLRQTIRDTWAAGHDNVYFVVGQPCSIPPAYRGVDPGGNSYCIPKQHHVIHRLQDYIDATMTYLSQQEQVAHRLRSEQDQYHDILLMQPDHVFTTNNNNKTTTTPSSTSSFSFLTYAQHSNAMIDMYRTLPHKLKTAYHFVSHHLPSTVQWVLKVDDDFYVRIDAMERQLNQLTFQHLPFSTRSRFSSIINSTTPTKTTIPPSQLPMVISGDIRREHKAFTSGKWKEISQYPPGQIYPPFPLGSYGHVVTRPIVEYVTKYSLGLLDYQGEDVSLGIWLDQVEFTTPYPSSATATTVTTTTTTTTTTMTGMAGFFGSHKKSTLPPPPLPQNITVTTTFLNWPDYMSNKGDCRKPLLHIVGHDVSSAKMKVCHRLDQGRASGSTSSLTAAEAALFGKPQLQIRGGGSLFQTKKPPAGGTLRKESQGRISTLKEFLLGQGKLKA